MYAGPLTASGHKSYGQTQVKAQHTSYNGMWPNFQFMCKLIASNSVI